MLYKYSIKDDKMNLEDGQIWLNNQGKKELLEDKDLPSAWSSFLFRGFFCVCWKTPYTVSLS